MGNTFPYAEMRDLIYVMSYKSYNPTTILKTVGVEECPTELAGTVRLLIALYLVKPFSGLQSVCGTAALSCIY